MRILIVHNHYGEFAVGGEASVMRAEAVLLKSKGHEVLIYERTNAEYGSFRLLRKLNAFFAIPWSKKGAEEVGKVLDEFRPDVMHVHNYWFLLSPSIFAAAKKRGIATVLTLHNYRLICPGGQFLRNGKVCELCLSGSAWRVLWHRCYPGKSLIKSFLSLRLYLNTKRKAFLSTWVDAYIALTSFGKQKFIEGGLPEEKIFVKPNFMDNPFSENYQAPLSPSYGAVCVGRISPEKGLNELMVAWKDIEYPLTVVGDGPLMEEIKRCAPPSVKFTGSINHEEVLAKISESAFLVFPSVCYEGFPLTILEAMALGKPVIASDIGPRSEMVRDGITGFLFRAGDSNDLQEKVRMMSANPERAVKMGKAAREVFLSEYSSEKNYEILIDVYRRILNRG